MDFLRPARPSYPRTQVQLRIVPQVRNSLKYVTRKDRKGIAASLRTIYTALTDAAASAALVAFTEQWGELYSAIAPA